jgi:hypothetical protein
MSRTANYATLGLAGLVFVLATIVPLWLAPIVALAVLLVGGALLEAWFLDD